MSDEPTSVRPELLADFAQTSQRIEASLETRISAARSAVSSFLAGTDPGLATAQPDLLDVGLPDLAQRLADTRRFATLLREAVLAADVHGAGGAVTLTHAQLMAGLSASGRQEFELLLRPAPLPPIDPPTLGAIPHDSGLVDDPVCTATGHFLEDELELVVPERVVALGWQRRYSSRQLDVGGHGPGWWTWAEVQARPEGDAVVVVCPDGRHLRFPVPAGTGPVGLDDIDATLTATGAGGWVVRWGLRNPTGPETWHFAAGGRPHLVEGALTGRIVLDHDDDGRLVSMAHEGGRSLRIDWDGDRIAAIRDGHGRSARYRYDNGHLAEVVRDSGGRSYATDVQGRIVEVVDADGVTLARNRYDAEGRVVRQVAPTGRVTVFRYEPGRRTAVLDGAGELICLYVHDHRGRVETMVSPHGAELTRSFDRDGRVASLRAHDGSGFTSEGSTDPDGTLHITHLDGRIEQVDHDHLGRVVRHELVGAGATTYEYEGDSICPSAVTSPTGARRTMTWRDGGVLVGTADGDGVSVELDVDGDGLPSSATNGVGHTVTVERAPAGVPVRIDLPGGERVVADVDAAGRLRRITGPDGAEATFEHSAAGRLVEVSSGDGAQVRFEYGPHGFLERATDELGQVVHVDIDEWGRPTSVGTDDAPRWQLGWSPLGVLTDVTTPGGARWHQELDSHHRVASIVDAEARTEHHEHDEGGRLTATRRPDAELRVGFDPAGRVDAVDATPGGRSSVSRDEGGRAVEVADADGVRTRAGYTPAGRLASQQVGDDEPITFDRDATGEIVAVHQAGATWRIERDWRGDATSVAAPSGRTLRIGRDPVGRPIEVDRAGLRERWEYDPQGQVVAHVTPSGTSVRIERDTRGRVVAVDGPGGRVEVEHDAAAGTTATIDPLGGRSEVRSDADGHVRERTDPLGRSTHFERSAGGALQAVVDHDGHRLGFEHDVAGRVAAAYDDGTALARYRYDAGHLVEVEEPARGRRTRFEVTPTGRLHAWDDETGRRAVVERDAAGRVTSRRGDLVPEARWSHEARARRGEVAGRAVAVELDVDGALARLAIEDRALEISRSATGEVDAARWRDAGGDHHLQLTRDEAGRVVAADLDGARSTYAYSDADRLVAWERDGIRTEWEHDAAGRVVTEREASASGTHERRFRYDAAHQLVAVEGPEGTIELAYDGAGRRVSERRSDGTERRYEWDALGRLRAVVDGDDRTEVDIDCFGRLRRVGTTELTWDLAAGTPELASIGGTPVVASGPLALAVGDEILVDHLLGPVAQGAHPFGEAPADATPTLACGLPGGVGFAGLVWLGDRILDPATGQFLSPDPLAATIGSPTQAFPYAYADGDPVNRADPTGRSGQPISIADFEEARQRSMGTQWGNIGAAAVTVGVVVGGALLAASGVGLVGLAVGGAVLGGVHAGAMSYHRDGSVDWTKVAVGAGFGAVGGAVGGQLSRSLQTTITGQLSVASPAVQRASSTMAGRMAVGGFTSAAGDLPVNAAHELVDSRIDGRAYSATNLAAATGMSFGTGALEEPARAVIRQVSNAMSSPAPTLSTMPQTPLDPVPALPAPQPQAALPAPQPQAALPAPQPRLDVVRNELWTPPLAHTDIVVATPALLLPDPPVAVLVQPDQVLVLR